MMRTMWTIQKRIHHHDVPRHLSETRAPLLHRGRSAVLVIVLGDGTILAARRAGPEDRRASDKMTVDVGVSRRRRERRQRVALTGRWRRYRMRVRVRMRPTVIGSSASERGGRRRHRRRYRRLGTRGHHGDIRRWHRTWQRSGARQGTSPGYRHMPAHYVARRTHGRRIIGPGRIDSGRRRTRIAVVAHVASTVVHFHAVEAHVIGWRRARVANVTRL